MQNFGSAWPRPEDEPSWRRSSLVAEIVFFVLTCVAIAAATVFLPGWLVMIACLALAEFLIRTHHFWRTGVESALWIGGLYAFIFSLPHSGKPEALLVLAAGAAIAGWRVRNALFGTLAAVLVLAYFQERHWQPLVFAFVVALIALFAITRAWRRQSTELLFQMLVIVMPVAVYIVAKGGYPIYAAFAIVCVIVGIRARLRVPFVAAAISLTIAVIDVHLPLSYEMQLIIGGAIAVATAAILTRALRNRTGGFVLDIPKQSELESIMSALPALPSAGPAVAAQPQAHPQGGEFGGAGASGSY